MNTKKLTVKLLLAVAFIFAVNASFTSAAIDECHWSIMGPTAVTFDWRGSDDTIYYGTTSGSYTSSQVASAASPTPTDSAGSYWECALTGLLQNTLYYYKIGSGTEHTFRTPPLAGSASFTIVCTSDWQESGSAHTQNCMNQIQGIAPRFVLVSGDLTGADERGISYIHTRFANMMVWSQDVAYMPTWGNHDYTIGEVTLMNDIKGRIVMPNSQSAGNPPAGGGDDWGWFDYGNVRFISCPDWWSSGSNDSYKDWATKADPIINAAQNDVNIKWVVVYVHRPPYSTGHHLNLGTSEPAPQINALADKYNKLKLCIAGHNHVCERSGPEGTHNVLYVVDGTPYGTYTSDDDWSTTPQTFTKFRARRGGFLKITFNADIIEGWYIVADHQTGEDASDKNPGDVLDHWTIGESSDANTPSPNPMTWATVPVATGPASITMTATTATDVSGVQYYFNNITDPNHNSGWRDSPSWTDTALHATSTYSYQVKAMDKSGNLNETAYSTVASATTSEDTDYQAPTPNPMTWASVPAATGPRSITMTASTASDSAGVQYYFSNISRENHDSGWRDSPTYVDTGLAPHRNYVYQVKARDKSGNLNETAYSTEASAATPPSPGVSVTIYSDGFEDGTSFPTIWNIIPSTSYVYITSAPYTGSKSVKLKGYPSTSSITKTISTAGYSSIHVKYARTIGSGSTDPFEAGEYLYAEWSADGGTTWNEFEHTAETTWALKEFVCGSAADDNPNFTLRFKVNANGSQEYAYVDALEVFVVGVTGDISNDGLVDTVDLAVFASHWLEEGCTAPSWCGGANLDQTNGTVDYKDLTVIVDHWLEGF